jgi:hypothetical protein
MGGRMITECIKCGRKVLDAEVCDDVYTCEAYKSGYDKGLIEGLDRAYRLLETRVVNDYRDLILMEKLRLTARHVCGLRGYDPMKDSPCPACVIHGGVKDG